MLPEDDPPSEGRTEASRAPLFPSHSGHSSDRWSSDPGDAPRGLTQARKRICEARPLMRPDGEERGGLRGSASHTALPCSEPPPTHPR